MFMGSKKYQVKGILDRLASRVLIYTNMAAKLNFSRRSAMEPMLGQMWIIRAIQLIL